MTTQRTRPILDVHEPVFTLDTAGVTATCACGWTWHSDTLTLAHERHQGHVEPYYWTNEATA